jgi:ribosomal peptide maturation radical SAM protein 1
MNAPREALVRAERSDRSYQSVSSRVPVEDFRAGDPIHEGHAPDTPSKKALLITMPFATPEFPALGATLIRSVLVAEGIPADIVYGNLVFSKLVAGDSFVENTLAEVPICEIAFTPYYFSNAVENAAEALRRHVLEMAVAPEAHTLPRYLAIVENAGRCIDSLFQSIPWDAYDVVGFSLLMGQTIASLALAKRIKAAYPSISIILGGAQTQPPMGEEMLRGFQDIDYVLPGEADGIVAPFIRELRLGVRRDFATPGILYRDQTGEVRSSGDAPPFSALDSLPVPDFTDFFAQMEELGLRHIQPYLPLETSRGCWWGAKRHCTFCGIDDKVMVFRSKAPGRVLQEILTLSQRHQYTEFFAVDSIINFRFFHELLPVIGQLRREQGWDFTFFFESKSNISREQARRFRYGGVNHVQPGLESFSDHVLRLMDKGTTAVRQIQCLKLLAEQNIDADWNLIIRNPGETAADYREIIELIPYLHHIPPLHQGGLVPMQINRYAPYHNEPGRYGITNIRPKPYYRELYPEESVNLERIAFYFDCDFEAPQSDELQTLHASLEHVLEEWRACYVPNALLQFNGPGFVRIVDRRSWAPGSPVAEGGEREYLLEGIAAQVFAYCADMRTVPGVVRQFADTCSTRNVIELMDRFVKLRLMYRSSSDEVIALPLVTEAVEHMSFVPGEPEKSVQIEVPAGLVAAGGGSGGTNITASPRRSAGLASSESGTTDAMRLVGSAARELVVNVESRPVSRVISEIEGTAERTRSLKFTLEGLETEGGINVALLEALAKIRAERLLGFEFACEILGAVGGDVAEKMRAAGISSVRLSAWFGRCEPSALAANLQRLSAVKALIAADISATWELDERTWSMSKEERERMIAICGAARHLPGPELKNWIREDPVSEAVIRWSTAFRPRSLTYARGPQFVRVLDRRKDDRNWRVISLRGLFAEVLMRCDRPKGASLLHDELRRPTEAEIRGCLESLVEQGIMCEGWNGQYLALPIRRAIEERWASGDN